MSKAKNTQNNLQHVQPASLPAASEVAQEAIGVTQEVLDKTTPLTQADVNAVTNATADMVDAGKNAARVSTYLTTLAKEGKLNILSVADLGDTPFYAMGKMGIPLSAPYDVVKAELEKVFCGLTLERIIVILDNATKDGLVDNISLANYIYPSVVEEIKKAVLLSNIVTPKTESEPVADAVKKETTEQVEQVVVTTTTTTTTTTASGQPELSVDPGISLLDVVSPVPAKPLTVEEELAEWAKLNPGYTFDAYFNKRNELYLRK